MLYDGAGLDAAHFPAVSEEASPRRRTAVALPPPRTYPTSPESPYAPGPIRAATDHEHAAVAAFLADHTQFARQPQSVVAQYMDRRAGYRSDDELALREALADEGVDLWHERDEPEGRDDFSNDLRWSDDA